MTNRQRTFGKTIALALLAVASVQFSATAEDLSAQKIIDGLKVPKMRSLSISSRPMLSDDDLAFVKRVRGQSRSLSLNEREQMANIAPKRPTVDLEITFDYNSATLSPRSEPQLKSLGKALTSEELAGSVIMLGGHTDAKGGESYNQGLSERRAETVKRFLVETYKIPAANLVTAGYGKNGLKNVTDPYASENRRVEIVNVAEREQASR